MKEEITNIFYKLFLNWTLFNAKFWIPSFTNKSNGFYNDKYLYGKVGKRWFKYSIDETKYEK